MSSLLLTAILGSLSGLGGDAPPDFIGSPFGSFGREPPAQQSFATYEVRSGDVCGTAFDHNAPLNSKLTLFCEQESATRDDTVILAHAERDARALIAWSWSQKRRQRRDGFPDGGEKERQALLSYEGVVAALRAIEKRMGAHLLLMTPEGSLDWAEKQGHIVTVADEIRRAARERTGVRVTLVEPVDVKMVTLRKEIEKIREGHKIHEAAALEVAQKHELVFSSQVGVAPKLASHKRVCDWIYETNRVGEMRAIEKRMEAERAAASEPKAAAKAAAKEKSRPEPFPIATTNHPKEVDPALRVRVDAAKETTTAPSDTQRFNHEVAAPSAETAVRKPIALITPEHVAIRVNDVLAAASAEIIDAAEYAEMTVRLEMMDDSDWRPFIEALDRGEEVDQADLKALRRAAIDLAHARLISLYPIRYSGDGEQIRTMADNMILALRNRS